MGKKSLKDLRPKKCKKCGKLLAPWNKSGLCSFHYLIEYRNSPNGRKKRKEWRERNKNLRKQYNKNYYKKHRKDMLKYGKKYYKENKEERKEKIRQYYWKKKYGRYMKDVTPK